MGKMRRRSIALGLCVALLTFLLAMLIARVPYIAFSTQEPFPVTPSRTPSSTPLPVTAGPPPTPTVTLMAKPFAMPSPVISDRTVETQVAEWLNSMSVQEKVGQMLIIGIPGTTLDAATRQLLSSVHPGGVVYLKRNALSLKQAKSLNERLQVESSMPLFIAIDHEGGHVMRFPSQSGFTHFPAPGAVGLAGCEKYAYEIARISGAELRAAGFNMVLGPIADVNTQADNPVIGTRAFGDDPAQVVTCVEEFVRGYMDVGLIPVLKHFPGHGNVAVDSHRDLPADMVDLETLHRVHLVPFKHGIAAGAPAVMMAHVAFPNIQSDGLPASLSPFFIQDILRKEMGFNGLVMSDAVGMGAVSQHWGPGTGAVMAVKAGEDMIIAVDISMIKPVYNSLLQAVQNGDLPMERVNEAMRRILRLKAQNVLNPSDLAIRVSREAITLSHDPQSLIPIEKGARVLIISPDNLDKGDVENNGLSYLGELLAADYIVREFFYHIPRYAPISEPDLLTTIPAQAANFDVVLFCTCDAHLRKLQFGDRWQIQLALVLQSWPLIIAALRSPYDYKALPTTSTYLATYGATRPQLEALVDVLKGVMEPRKASIPKGF